MGRLYGGAHEISGWVVGGFLGWVGGGGVGVVGGGGDVGPHDTPIMGGVSDAPMLFFDNLVKKQPNCQKITWGC